MDIREYHHDTPNWRNTQVDKEGTLIGIELEVFNKNGRIASANALDELVLGKFPAPIAERDGSLDGNLGVEIICPPLPLEEVRKDNGYIGRIMSLLSKAGCEAEQPDGYGMHININVVDWKENEKLCVQYLLNRFNIFGSTIGKRVGERRTFGTYFPYFSFFGQRTGAVGVTTHMGDKHTAAYLRRPERRGVDGRGDSRVLEARFPKSTLDVKDMYSALDYIFAVRDWVRAAPNHTLACCFFDKLYQSTALEELFLSWCGKYRPDVLKLLKDPEYKTIKTGRLLFMQDAFESAELARIRPFHEVNLSEPQNISRKKQALRIGSIISKGARLQGKQDYEGRYVASSLQPVD